VVLKVEAVLFNTILLKAVLLHFALFFLALDLVIQSLTRARDAFLANLQQRLFELFGLEAIVGLFLLSELRSFERGAMGVHSREAGLFDVFLGMLLAALSLGSLPRLFVRHAVAFNLLGVLLPDDVAGLDAKSTRNVVELFGLLVDASPG
jgi:hypothetical protein